jgi:hypothetical protein
MRYYIQNKRGWFYSLPATYNPKLVFDKDINEGIVFKTFDICNDSARFLAVQFNIDLRIVSCRGLDNDRVSLEGSINWKDL